MHDTTIYTTLCPGPRGHWGLRLLLHLRLNRNLRTLPTEHVLRLGTRQHEQSADSRDELRTNAGLRLD